MTTIGMKKKSDGEEGVVGFLDGVRGVAHTGLLDETSREGPQLLTTEGSRSSPLER